MAVAHGWRVERVCCTAFELLRRSPIRFLSRLYLFRMSWDTGRSLKSTVSGRVCTDDQGFVQREVIAGARLDGEREAGNAATRLHGAQARAVGGHAGHAVVDLGHGHVEERNGPVHAVINFAF